MAEKHIGAVAVIEDERLVGIFSERDYARRVILEGRSSIRTQVKVTMTGDVVSIGPDGSVDDCISLMTDNRIRHLPVLEGEQLIGIISVGDVIKSLISDRKT
jgi:CBS domain-containing protein